MLSALVVIVAGSACGVDAQAVAGEASFAERPAGDSIPENLLGDFIDDYGIRYTIDEHHWEQDGGTGFEIRAWSESGRFLIARSENDSPSAPVLWTRIDWVLLPTDAPGEATFTWAFCYAVYDAKSEAEARAAPPSDREHPRTGCNGFPFSRMMTRDDRAAHGPERSRRPSSFWLVPQWDTTVDFDGEVFAERTL
jgi:hypothetical protein